MPNAVVPSTHHLADFFVKFPAALGSILSGRQSQDEDEEEADQQQQQPPQQQTASLNLTTREIARMMMPGTKKVGIAEKRSNQIHLGHLPGMTIQKLPKPIAPISKQEIKSNTINLAIRASHVS